MTNEQRRAESVIERRKVLKTIGMGAGTVALAGCAGDSGDDAEIEGVFEDGADVQATITQNFDNLDPHQTAGVPDCNVISHVYESLITKTGEGEIVPELATDWERIEPGRFRFELRDDVVFHNGNEFTADDVQYSVRRIIDPDVGLVSDRQGFVGGVTDAEIIDDYTIDIISDGLNTTVERSFASYIGVDIQNREWVEDLDAEEANQSMNGTGPYELVDYTPGEFALFEPFDDYYGDTRDLDSIRYTHSGESSTRVNQLLAGESHLIESAPPTDVPRIEDEPTTEVIAVPSARPIHGVMDVSQEPFDSLEFRQALNWAIDVEGYVDDVLQGFGAPLTQPGIPGMFGYDEDLDPWGYDPDRAADLVEESGYSGVEIELTVPVGRYLLGAEVGNSIANDIDQLPNVSCELVELEFQTFSTQWTDTQPDDMPFFIVGYGLVDFDGTVSLAENFVNDRLNRYGGEGEEQITEIYEEALRTADREEREELVRQGMNVAVDDAAWLFLHQQYSVYGVNTALDWEARQDELMTMRDVSLEDEYQ